MLFWVAQLVKVQGLKVLIFHCYVIPTQEGTNGNIQNKQNFGDSQAISSMSNSVKNIILGITFWYILEMIFHIHHFSYLQD